jgi:hypothetical protein
MVAWRRLSHTYAFTICTGRRERDVNLRHHAPRDDHLGEINQAFKDLVNDRDSCIETMEVRYSESMLLHERSA